MLKHTGTSLLFFVAFMAIQSCSGSKSAVKSGSNTEHGSEADFSSGFVSDTLTIERIFIDGCKAKTLGDYDGAIALFKEVLQMDANNDAAMFELGKIYFEYNRLDDASELAKRAVELNPDNEYYLILYGEVLLYAGRYADAAKVFETNIARFPQNMEAYFELAYAYERSNNVKESIRVLLQAENTFGTDEMILMEQYRLYIRNGYIDDAIAVLNKLIVRNPDEPAYYSMLMEVYESAEKTELAEETFNKLIAIDPDNPDLLFKQAEFHKRAGNIVAYKNDLRNAYANPDGNIDRKIFFLVPYVDSVDNKNFSDTEFILELTELLIQVHPSEAKAFAMRGDLLYYAKRQQDARISYRQSVNLRPDVFDVWIKLFYIDLESNAFDSLLTVTGSAIELFPNQALAHYFNGVALQNLKRNEEAIRAYKRAIPLTAANQNLRAETYLRLGDIYNELKQYSDSDNAYDLSLQAEPDNAYTLNNYAYYLSLRGEKLDKAAEMASKANQLIPNNSSLQDTYAWVLYKQNKFADARIWLEKALQNSGSNSAVINEHYGDVLYKIGSVDEAVFYWEKSKSLGNKSEVLQQKINDRKMYE